MSPRNELTDLRQYGAETIAPHPASLIETFRAIGYSLPAAIADIVDNSISAHAKNVWLDFKWKEADSFITIHDDGDGMTREELIEAMRPGTRNPLESRKEEDLGRFGLGLKTASFSQCRILTVISRIKTATETNVRSWNLDYVEKYNEWQILNYVSDEQFREKLAGQPSGTTVIWEHPDRIIYDQEKNLISESKFYEVVRETEQHLAMVFHRFLETGRLKIWLNNQSVSPWDPFLRTEPATQTFPTESFSDDQIKITGYVLPHASKIPAETWKRAAGINDWNAQQGFYIYRKDRMLVAGDWLQLFRKEDSTRLARIMIDINASLDFSWQLDIRKSRAIPPKMFRDELKRYAAGVRKIAVDVFKHRGKQKQRLSGRSHFEFAWITEEDNGREHFRINRNHPLVRSVSEKLQTKKGELEKLLKLLEVTLPVPAIVLNESLHADNPADSGLPVKDSEILDLMKSAYKQLLEDGLTSQKAREELYFIDPFSNYPHLVEQLEK
jgi:hypothetical protein